MASLHVSDRLILAFESSCDDSSVAVVKGSSVLAIATSSQTEHREWGGVVPEIASRAHLDVIPFLTNRTMTESGVEYSSLSAIAATVGPGLIGSLLVGVNVAKGLSVTLGIPFVGVNHIEAHLFSVMLEHEVQFPFLALAVSGGHTHLFEVRSPGEYLLIGCTRDDAAGEAFDKGAKMLGLGYPGGIEIDRLSRSGDRNAISFPRAFSNADNFEFSFSGLKTALRYHIRDTHDGELPTGEELHTLCASYQEAIVDALLLKTKKAVEMLGYERVAVVGGVSANSRLRQKFSDWTSVSGLTLYTTSKQYSTDNAAMIGLVASLQMESGNISSLTLSANPTAHFESIHSAQ